MGWPRETRYYLADSSGVQMTSLLKVESHDGEVEVPWTIPLYLKISGMKWQSRARFFCVRVPGTGLLYWVLALL